MSSTSTPYSSPLLQTGLKYGVTGGGLAILLFVTLYFLEASPLDSLRLFDFVLIPLFVFFTLKEVRDYRLEGKLAYWQGMTAGFVCYTTIAMVSALFILLFLSVLDPATLVQHQKESMAVLTNNPQEWIDQIGAQAYEEAMADVEQLTALDLALDDFLKKVLIGLFLTGIITLFFKR